ncbi:pyridoxamine 5'-phosphate oxidase family protein [Amycolatopsis sp. FDAARGOS 1241]|uniref:pyridoxamine 5'-phosphate oxidase family protein n=1 Tax=Amycolatopsis sp. FDAARGOS 1241 TaxID=2778070 RepID=UPI00194F279B|nr:pyridoxamine 5'-phosphate oxidase family protein [Amycolatopsis sp. FDAARGOS 1241]QRP47781.1 pyridoxamine 5'-phosphate oxidase family protein [Amycolatopsis sp. FDAARGOS 1241]
MTEQAIAAGFHPGELSVQRQAGLEYEAARLEGMLAPAHLSRGAGGFLAQREFAAVTARAADGTLWTAPLLGRAGFLEGFDTTLVVHTRPAAGDPLHELPAGQAAGLLAVEFATRRRLRVNGTVVAVGEGGFLVDVEQAYGNCPSYIQQRRLAIDPGRRTVDVERSDALTAAHRELIRHADTFLLGTTHPTRGADTSHKGGEPGFVRVDGADLWWPDYAGNNMFNSLGNIASDPEASLLFVDFTTGSALQLTGTATLEWVTQGTAGEDDATGRRVRFHPAQMVSQKGLALHSSGVVPSPHNPHVTA